MLRLILAALILSCHVLLSATASADRNCTAPERAAADAQLVAIAADPARQGELIVRHLPHGEHISTHEVQGGPDNEVLLVQGGYVLLHDADLRTGLWVSYELTGEDAVTGPERVNCFRKDPRLTVTDAADPSNYNEPIFDQGHMANDADMKDDLTEQINSYVMSNMSPQYCRFNRGVWLSLEHLGRIWAKKYGTVYITSGAIFDFNSRDARDKDASAARMGSRNQKARVAIPSDYYKIFLRQEGDDWHSIAFLLEHNNERNGIPWSEIRPLVETSIVLLEEIEERAEISYYPELDRAGLIQNADVADWDFTVGKNNLEGMCG